MKSPSFEVAAFKGVGLSLRDWNGQLRQPILVATPKLLGHAFRRSRASCISSASSTRSASTSRKPNARPTHNEPAAHVAQRHHETFQEEVA